MIYAKDIYFSYTGGQPYVLVGLEFYADTGQYISILGENGSCKSSFAKLLLGLLSPSRGARGGGHARLRGQASRRPVRGQRQKAFIARALMGEPGLLVFDEPSAGVDVGSRREIFAYLRRLNVERGMTILSVEHNLEAALRNSTSIYHIENGRGHECSPATYEREYLRLNEGDRP